MLAGNGIPVGVCISCLLDTIRNAKQYLGLALIGAARQKQCQTNNGKVSFPASQKSYKKQGLPRLRNYNTLGNCGTLCAVSIKMPRRGCASPRALSGCGFLAKTEHGLIDTEHPSANGSTEPQ